MIAVLTSIMRGVSCLAIVGASQPRRFLSDAGLGSDLQLILPVENPFEGSGNLQSLEDVSIGADESLNQEIVPPDFKSSQSFGQFALASSFIQEERSKVPSGFIEVSVDRTSSQLESTAEFREVGLLNQQTDKPHSDQTYVHRDSKPDALLQSVSYSGPTAMDFQGPCKSGYTPFLKTTSSSLEDCWIQCRSNLACTQVHFSQQAETCYMSHGISVGPTFEPSTDVAMPASVCRSLTPSGIGALNKGFLPAFRQLPNNEVYLGGSTATMKKPLVVDSLAECQSACLDASESCQYGVWLAKVSGKNDCFLATSIAASRCPVGVAECTKACGDEDCVLFERNMLNMAGPAVMQSLDARSVTPEVGAFPMNISETRSCESKCEAFVNSESVCITLCLVEARSLCQAACASKQSNCAAAGFFYGGNGTNQVCVSYSTLPSVNTTTPPAADSETQLVDIFIQAQSATIVGGNGFSSSSSLLESRRSARAFMIRKLSEFLAPTDVRPKFVQFQGPCDVFDEGVLAGGTGPGISRFGAQSIDECWRLCESYSNNQCSQVHYHASTSECVLGDAIAKGSRSDGTVICRSLEYTPISSSNGLSGMMYVDSVAGMRNASSYWFSDAGAPVLVSSVEECQALCKAADSGAADAVCRYGGYDDCTSFHATYCQGTGASHPDCALCDKNPSGGVCRIPSIPVSSQPSGASAVGESALPCAGGKCRWFERGTNGYSLQVATGVNMIVDYSPLRTSGMFCDSLAYLPNAKTFTTASGSGCYYPVESLWHCEHLCSTINKVAGTSACIGGLYRDKEGDKQCRLARYRLGTGKACDGNCGWFELAGEGKTAGLEVTGAKVAETSRQLGSNLFTLGLGPCQQFRALDAVITNTPSGFQFSPIEDCSHACAAFPQCSSFQVTGSVSSGTCDILKGRESDCTFITCSLSSALSLATPSGNNMTLCWTKTPLGTAANADEAIDMIVDPGIPGYMTTNARVRRFGWDDVVNKDRLALTMTMEECQSMCRVSDGCISGTWQHCQSIEQFCTSDALPGTPQEVKATCSACRSVPVSEAQQSIDFPEHLGVCKMASQIRPSTQGCFPEPCYAFEEGSENYFIMSTDKSAFVGTDRSVDLSLVSVQGEAGAYVKTKSLADCENACTADATCRYGHYVPRSTGYGECYLTSQEIRYDDGYRFRMKSPVGCDGPCIVFMKLTTKLPNASIAAPHPPQSKPATTY